MRIAIQVQYNSLQVIARYLYFCCLLETKTVSKLKSILKKHKVLYPVFVLLEVKFEILITFPSSNQKYGWLFDLESTFVD